MSRNPLNSIAPALALLGGMLACGPALAQATAAPPAPTPWSLAASAYTYFIPEGDDYVQPTIRADRGRLHLEARCNYEALHTASTWIGWSLSVGES